VPLQAVSRDNDKATVFVVDASGKIVSRPVVLGIQTPDDAEVLSGLQPGEMVVVSDTSSLRPGERVNSKTVELVQYQSQDDRK
jgi:multidrug efflux pump subunit AcrA (membrane-fusion protein)